MGQHGGGGGRESYHFEIKHFIKFLDHGKKNYNENEKKEYRIDLWCFRLQS